MAIQAVNPQGAIVHYSSNGHHMADLMEATKRGITIAQWVRKNPKIVSAIAKLVKTPIFKGITAEELTILIETFRVPILEIQENQSFIEEGSRQSHFFFVVIAGEADIRKDGQFITKTSPWEAVGHFGYISDDRRTATVTANTRTLLLQFSKDILISEKEIQHQFLINISKLLARQVNQMNEKISLLIKKIRSYGSAWEFVENPWIMKECRANVEDILLSSLRTHSSPDQEFITINPRSGKLIDLKEALKKSAQICETISNNPILQKALKRLSETEIMKGVSYETIIGMVKRNEIDIIEIKEGEILLEEWSLECDSFYVVLHGSCDFYKNKEKVASSYVGDPVWHFAYLGEMQRTATVVASKNSILVRFNRKTLSTDPITEEKIVINSSKNLVQQMNQMNSKMLDLLMIIEEHAQESIPKETCRRVENEVMQLRNGG